MEAERSWELILIGFLKLDYLLPTECTENKLKRQNGYQ